MAVLCSRCREFEEPITCFLSESGPCSVCKERATIRDQIKQLEDEIAKMKAKHDTLTTPMNAIHDPFIHKLPPRISSSIFRLSLPTLTNEEHLEAILESWDNRDSAKILRLGGVCRMWRKLAWETPDLWDILYLRTGRLGCSQSVAKLLPDLVCEWLERSRNLPLTIFYSALDSDDAAEVANELIVEILNSHSHRWRILNLTTTAHTFRRFSASIQPNQLVGLGLRLVYQLSNPFQPPNFLMESELTPTHLALDFPLASINVRWDSITHLTLRNNSIEECVDVLRRAPGLEWYNLFIYPSHKTSFIKPILHRHPRLRSLRLSTSYDIKDFLEALNLPSLEEWTQDVHSQELPVAATLSLFERSGCRLKVLHLTTLPHDLEGLTTLLQAIPSLERLRLSFRHGLGVNIMMDDILARIFRPAPGSSNSSGDDPASGSFLPLLQFMECTTLGRYAPFTWDRIPQLYRQGHQRSLTLSSVVHKLDITDETALQLLELTDEGLDLQIFDLSMGGCNFLKKFRERMCEQGI